MPMTEDPRPKKGDPPPTGDEEAESERPTVNPPFDVEAFAREATGPGNAHAATRRPPPPAPVPVFEAEDSTARVTLTNEIELEKAIAASAVQSQPPRSLSSSALSMADARAPRDPSEPPPARSMSPTSIEKAVLGALGPASALEISEQTLGDPMAEMRSRFSLGDYTGALEMAELVLAEEPGNLEAAECGENCRSVLEKMYVAQLGPLGRVPMVVVPRTQMRWLSIDHRAGFIVSLIDGSSSIEMVLDVCGMPRLDALRILHELVQQKIVAFR